VFIHGGFWRSAIDRKYSGPLANDLAARGWPVAAIEYRRVGQEGGGWPGTFDDVRAALRAVPELVSGLGVDGRRPILAGHSAGGHLAMWYSVEEPDRVGGVLALAPVCDLVATHDQWLDNGAAADLLGGGPEQVPDRYDAADPMVRPRPDVPIIVVHGTQDQRVPVQQSREYARRHGVQLAELPGMEHFGVVDPESPAWPFVLTSLTELNQSLT
jgi:acetyl esterase/lipase